MEYKLLGMRVMEIVPQREMVLEYYLMTGTDSDNCTDYYGVQIRKHENGNVKEEVETVNGLTDSREFAVQLVNVLLENAVTPISMVDIIDDYITEKVCS